MAERIEIIVEARDQASSILGSLSGSLGRIFEYATGGLLARGIEEIAGQLRNLAGGALSAAADMQTLTVSFEGLVAKELAMGEEVEVQRQVRVELTEKEREELQKLISTKDILNIRLQQEQLQLEQLQARYAEVVTKEGEGSLAARDLALDIQMQQEKIEELNATIQENATRYDELTRKAESYTTQTEKVRVGQMDFNEALQQAGPRAEELLQWLRTLSVQSPFEYRLITEAFRFTMAMGASSEQAQGLTEAMLNLGAGLGMSTESFNRMIYNMSQALVAGDLTAANMRQLRMIGIDLAEVFETELGKSIEDVQAGLKSGAIELTDIQNAFISYVDRVYSGSADRLSKTFQGLKSNVSDLLFFAGADLLTPTLGVVTDALSGLMDKGIELVNSGVFKRAGEQLAVMVDQFIKNDLPGIIQRLVEFWDRLQNIDFGSITESARGFAESFISPEIVGGIVAIGDGIRWFIENQEAVIGAIQAIGGAILGLMAAGQVAAILGSITSPLGLIMTIVGGLGAAWKTNFGDIQGKTAEVWAIISPILENLRLTIGGIAEIVSGRLKGAFGDMEAPLGKFGEWLDKIWTAFREHVMPAFTDASAIVQEKMGPALDRLMTALGPLAEVVMGKIVPAFIEFDGRVLQFVLPALAELATFIIGTVLPILIQIQTFILEYVVTTFENLGDAIAHLKQIWDENFLGIRETVEAFWGAILSFVKAWMDLLSGDWEGFAEYFKEGVNLLFDAVGLLFTNFFVTLGEMVTTGFNNIIKIIKEMPWFKTGQAIIQGIIDGINSMISAAVAAAAAGAQAVKNVIASILGLHSPSTVMIEYGKLMMSGLAIGAQQGTAIATAAVGQAGAEILGATQNYYTQNMSRAGGSVNVTIQAGALLSFADESDLEAKLKPLLVQWGFALAEV